MERDPVRFVWRSAVGLHLLFVLLVILVVPAAEVGVELVRAALDEVIGGRPVQPFLRLAVTLPERIREEPVVLVEGIPLGRAALAGATVGGLAALAAIAALVVLAAGAIHGGIEARAVARLRSLVLDAILAARPAAEAEARDVAALVGPRLREARGFLGSALTRPLAVGTAVAVALLYAFAAEWRLGLAVGAGLIAFLLVRARHGRARARAVANRTGQSTGFAQALADLSRRLSAVRAHGTAAFERQRLSGSISRGEEAVSRAERKVVTAGALTALAWWLPALAALAIGAWLGGTGLSPGQVAAAALAATMAAVALDALVEWRQGLDRVSPLFEDVARGLGALHSRGRRDGAPVPLPEAGALALQGVSAYDPATGARVSGVDLSLTFPAHVAVTGDVEATVRVLAAVVAGQLEPSLGKVSFAGVDLAQADPTERARRIAFSGGSPVLVPGTLRENLLYGSLDRDGPEVERRLGEAAAVTGLDAVLHARGLSGTIDPERDPGLAEAIVEARRGLLAALKPERLDRFVDPFDLKRYNRHATVGENILFGMPLGDTFREANLPSHPFVRAVLEAEDLMRPLQAMGLSIATSMVEIFADIPDGHPLFARFSFFSSLDRGYFEDLVDRQSDRRRGTDPARDRERLIGLALRYSESRHRLGLVDAAMEERILAARAAFAQMLPTSLRPAIEFYDPARLCAAASLQDNLLFGRIAQDQAGAEEAVYAAVRRVLTARGLDGEVVRLGLAAPVDPGGGGLSPSELAALDLARCLVRRPDIIVVERALTGLARPAAAALLRRLRQALVGRGLVVVLPDLGPGMEPGSFDAVVRVERGAVATERVARAPAPVPA